MPVSFADNSAQHQLSQLQEELAGMKISALKQRARADGVEQSLIDETDDAASPRAALTALLLQRLGEQSGSSTIPEHDTEPELLTTGTEQYDIWKEWDGMFGADDGIEKLVANDFKPPAFYLRDSPETVWVVLYCTPSSRGCARTAEMYKELAGLLRGHRRARVGLVNLGVDLREPTPELKAATALGVHRPGSIQIFHYTPADYAAGVSVPLYQGRYSGPAVYREVRRSLGESLFWEDVVALLSRPAVGLGGATLVLAWVLYRGVSWATASAESLVEEKTAPETAKQRAEVSKIAADTLEARRKRQAELMSQRKAAAAALQAERTKVIAAEKQKQRQADVEARKMAQEEAQVKLAEGGERWKEAERAKRAKRLADAQEKLRKMRGERPEDAPFAQAGPGQTLAGHED